MLALRPAPEGLDESLVRMFYRLEKPGCLPWEELPDWLQEAWRREFRTPRSLKAAA